MKIDQLLSDISVVGELIERPSPSDWTRFESEHGAFPSDFKFYLSSLGTGVLAEFFIIWNPFSTIDGVNWCREYEQSRQSFLEVYPSYTRLVPFGHTMNGDTLFWQTDGDPDLWGIAVAREEPVLQSDELLGTFLYSALTTLKYSVKLPDLRRTPKVFRSLAGSRRA